MSGIRKALAFTASSRYINLLINFATTAIVARLLTPGEIGLAMIGTSLIAIPEAFNEFGITNYIIQKKELTRHNARAAFTVGLAIAVVLTLAMYEASILASGFYGKPELQRYLHVIIVGFLIGPFLSPLTSLLKRDMEFGRIAVIAVVAVVVNAILMVGLAATGFGFMSIAWAALGSGVATLMAAAVLSPNYWVYVPTLRGWREVANFGGFASATVLLGRAYAMFPYLIFGKLLPDSAAGLYSRAVVICELPDKGVFSGLLPVALPALAAEARVGGDLKRHFLRAISYITAVQWPILACLVLLAEPIVRLLLGAQWTAVPPLVQLMALAAMFSFPLVLAFPMFVALGRIKDAFLANLISLPISALVLFGGASISLEAAAASLILTVPLQAIITLVLLRRVMPFRWGELARAVTRSAAVGLCAAMPPALAVVMSGSGFALSTPVFLVAGLAAGLCWLGALWGLGHPLMSEVFHLGRAVAGALAARRAHARGGTA